MQLLGIQVLNEGGQNVAGSSIWIAVMLTNQQAVYTTDFTTSGTPVPIGPPASVTMTLVTPSGQIKISQAPMTPDPNNSGYFTYNFLSLATDETGYWYSYFNYADGTGNVGISPARTLFDMVQPPFTGVLPAMCCDPHFLGYIAAPPISGTFNIADYYLNSNPIPGSPEGWVYAGASGWLTKGIVGNTTGQ